MLTHCEEDGSVPQQGRELPGGSNVYMHTDQSHYCHESLSIFYAPSLFGALIFDNTGSDARDHCANERNFLSYLRLSIYMLVCSIAFKFSFSLENQPSRLSPHTESYFSIIFWCLSLACVGLGFMNYLSTVIKYGQRKVIVQSGWKTHLILIAFAISICWVCFFLLATDASDSEL